MQELTNFIRSRININNEELEIILSHFKEQDIQKNKFVFRQGQIANDYYFIQSGGLRFYFNSDEAEITAWVAFENEFFTEITSLQFQTPSLFNIHAVEDTILLTISHKDMESLYSRFTQWQEFGRKIHEFMLARTVKHLINLQTLTAEERYLFALKEASLLQRIPLKQLSSYLGITPNSLSRIRKNIK